MHWKKVARFIRRRMLQWLTALLLAPVAPLSVQGAEIKIGAMTPLHIAAQHGDLKTVEAWIKSGKSLDTPYNDRSVVLGYTESSGSRVRNKTALMFAAEAGRFDVAKLLVDAGADLYLIQKNADGESRGTAFETAVLNRHAKIAKYLWEKSDRKRFAARAEYLLGTTLYEACGRPADMDTRELAVYLLDNVANPAQAAAAFDNISRANCPELVQYLLGRGVKPSVAALVGAAEAGNIALMRQYIAAGADPKSPAPLLAAARQGKGEAVKLLLEHGANPNSRDSSGMTPLIWAVCGGTCIAPGPTCEERLGSIRTLLQYGASVKLRDNMGRSPLDYIDLFGPNDILTAPKKALFAHKGS